MGDFKDSFKILKYCLESLFRTSHNKTYFTVVNNGSCQEVLDYLTELKKENKINEILVIDDGSKYNYSEEICIKFSNCKYHFKENGGFIISKELWD